MPSCYRSFAGELARVTFADAERLSAPLPDQSPGHPSTGAVMSGVATFFTAYSALRRGERVEVIAVVVLEGSELEHRYIVVDETGASSIARSEELNLYGVVDDAEPREDWPGG